MADLLPNNFPIPNEPAVASYDFINFATGQGYVTLYLAGSIQDTSSTIGYFLTPQRIESDYNARRIIGNSAWDVDFDILFLRPYIIQGDVIITSFQNGGGGAVDTPTWSVIKVAVGGAETVLATLEVSSTGAGTINLRTCVLTVAKTKIGVGEKLRINFASTLSGSAYVGIDPIGRTTQTETSSGATIGETTKVQIPLRVE